MKTIAILFAILALSFAHDDEDENDYNSLCETGYPSPFGDGWFYLGDMASTEGFTSAFDNSTGRTYYWNICGYDDNDALEEICGDDNVVCYSPGGEVSATAYFPAGSYDALSAEAIEENGTVAILLVYGNGAYCSGKSAVTSFALICDESATTPIVDSFAYSSDGCDALLTIRTSSACVRETLPAGCEKFWNKRYYLHIAFWSFVSLFSICCCCACCVAIKRRRCQRRRGCRMQYTEMESQASKSTPAPIAQPVPQQVPQQVSQPTSTPQLIQMGGQYFMNVNGVQYPVQLVPAPQYSQYMQQQQQQPEAVPLVPLAPEEEVVDVQSTQLEEDEKFARQLQSQLNQN